MRAQGRTEFSRSRGSGLCPWGWRSEQPNRPGWRWGRIAHARGLLQGSGPEAWRGESSLLSFQLGFLLFSARPRPGPGRSWAGDQGAHGVSGRRRWSLLRAESAERDGGATRRGSIPVGKHTPPFKPTLLYSLIHSCKKKKNVIFLFGEDRVERVWFWHLSHSSVTCNVFSSQEKTIRLIHKTIEFTFH